MRAPIWTKGLLLLAATLAAGFGLGVAYERAQPTSAHVRPAVRDHLIDRLNSELDLDASQRAALERILERRQREMDSTWHAMQPHVRATLDSTLREVESVLKPDQVSKYRKLVESMHSSGHHR
ncbi:MAG: hypothetical protein WD690_14045 [Vicinamibacterales bacterium]